MDDKEFKKMADKIGNVGIEGAENLLEGIVTMMKLMDLDNPTNKDHETYRKGSVLLKRLKLEMKYRSMVDEMKALDKELESLNLSDEDGNGTDDFLNDFFKKHSQN